MLINHILVSAITKKSKQLIKAYLSDKTETITKVYKGLKQFLQEVRTYSNLAVKDKRYINCKNK